MDRSTPQPASLRVLIVGAGIGGLTAGLALRRAGHDVTLLETSKFSNETGAAIHIAPNCNGLLLRLGLDVTKYGSNEHTGLAIYGPDGAQKMFIPNTGSEAAGRWQHSWHHLHRAQLHSGLREIATASEGDGKPCKLRLASKVISVDTENAEVELESGERISADVIVGADGVHSVCREYLEGGKGYVPYDSGHSAFRFMVPRSELAADPETKDLLGQPGQLTMVFCEDRRLVYYPCNQNTLMNFLLIHPSSESRAPTDDWNQKGDNEAALKIGSSLPSRFQSFLQKIPEDSLKVWTLLDLPALHSWTNGSMALLGDAAHPFLPHQGQGGAQAIEDAVALAVVLPLGTKVSDIPERLRLYQQIRKERATAIQSGTRLSGQSLPAQQKAGFSPFSFTNYNFSHDEYHNSILIFNKWLRNKEPEKYRWRQTLSFGPSPGPRQPLNSLPDIQDMSEQHSYTHSIRFTTSGTYLRALFPTEQFSFRDPNTLVQATVSCTELKNMVWLGGTGYRLVGLWIHGVDYTKKDGTKIHGTFMPLMFENLVDPIITGREELGAPKWGCDIDPDSSTDGGARIIMSWRGTVFGTIEVGDIVNEPVAENSRPKPTPDDGILMYRYVPAVGEPGKADVEYPVFDPYPKKSSVNGHDSNEASELKNTSTDSKSKSKIFQTAKLSFKAGDWKSLPTIHHFAQGLADMPIYEILEAKAEHVDGVSDFRTIHRIE